MTCPHCQSETVRTREVLSDLRPVLVTVETCPECGHFEVEEPGRYDVEEARATGN